MKRRILFVDDETKVLQGLQRMLRPMRHEWEMSFAESGPAALQTLAEKPLDVVVSDMRMPGMDGVQLLTEVMQRYPQIVRIVLSGQSDRETILRSVGPTHQYLSKPCDAELLKATVARACALQDLLSDETLKGLVSQMESLPSLPSLYLELMRELESSETSIKKVGEIISKDMGMTSKMLQLVNSAFFGLRQQVSNPAQAVSFLGLDTIKALVPSFHVFSQFDQARSSNPFLNGLWDHSMAVGTYAKQIAQAENQEEKVTANAFAAGLLHDSGKLVLAANLREKYFQIQSEARDKKIPLIEAEQKTLGADVTHARVGAYLLGLWGLPDPIVEAVAFHHCPRQCLGQSFTPLTAVHTANAFEHAARTENDKEVVSSLDLDYLMALGLGERVPTWQKNCLPASQEGDRR